MSDDADLSDQTAQRGPAVPAPTAARAALECRGLRGGHGPIVVFADLDLDLAAGEVLALLGPNGAGKTTLLLTLAGLLPRMAGTVRVDGHALAGAHPAAASKVGLVLVPDDRALFTRLTVEENLQVCRRPRGRAPRELLEVFPALARRWTVPAGALSGGEQQMLAMARALIQEPKVMAIDEPSQGLAPLVVEALFDTIRRVADEHGAAVVLVEQHVEMALGISDRAAVLQRGRVVLEGSAADVRDRYDELEAAYLGRGGTATGGQG
jgi:branched-chain amino acid transport system ATP-binding protein